MLAELLAFILGAFCGLMIMALCVVSRSNDE